MMNPHPTILVACDKFKGSLGAAEVCAAIARGLANAMPGARIDMHPIADGGEGFASSLRSPLNGSWVEIAAHDPLGRPITARYVLGEADGETVAVVEMAEASGMWRVAVEDRDILRSNTYGTGELMRHAILEGKATRLIVGLGGSATNDGGSGMAAALGVRFHDADGAMLDPRSDALAGRLVRVDVSGRITLPPIQAACDVDHPLLGPRGATRVFGPQKGAGEAEMPILEDALERLVRAANAGCAVDTPGAGAAGGLGFGLMAFTDAELVPGFELVAGLSGLERRILEADLVVTGEGSLDLQSLGGKGPVALARLVRRMGKPVIAFCGSVDDDIRQASLFDEVWDLKSTGLPLETLMSDAESLLTALAESFGNSSLSKIFRNET